MLTILEMRDRNTGLCGSIEEFFRELNKKILHSYNQKILRRATTIAGLNSDNGAFILHKS